MTSTKQLFCCGLLVLSLAGCGSLPREAPGESPSGTVPPLSGPPSADAAEALFHALSTLDIDYRHGGQTRASGFDCSGLVRYVFTTAYGITLPRLAHEQGRAGLAVSRARLEPGDLVFYNTQNQPFSHVGIYLGDERFVHAPRAGAAVRVENMRAAYWTRRFDGARRIPTAGRSASLLP